MTAVFKLNKSFVHIKQLYDVIFTNPQTLHEIRKCHHTTRIWLHAIPGSPHQRAYRVLLWCERLAVVNADQSCLHALGHVHLNETYHIVDADKRKQLFLQAIVNT